MDQQPQPVSSNSFDELNSVVFARGRDIDNLPGNLAYRSLARERAQEYKSCPDNRAGNARKREIAKEIMNAFGNRIFVRVRGEFHLLDEIKATKKIMQTIRDMEVPINGVVQSHDHGDIDHQQIPVAEDNNVDPGVVPKNENNRGLDHQQNPGAGGNDLFAEATLLDPGVVPKNENNRGLDHQQNAGAGGNDLFVEATLLDPGVVPKNENNRGLDHQQNAGASGNDLFAEATLLDPGVVPNNENNRGLDHQQNAGAGGNDLFAEATLFDIDNQSTKSTSELTNLSDVTEFIVECVFDNDDQSTKSTSELTNLSDVTQFMEDCVKALNDSECSNFPEDQAFPVPGTVSVDVNCTGKTLDRDSERVSEAQGTTEPNQEGGGKAATLGKRKHNPMEEVDDEFLFDGSLGFVYRRCPYGWSLVNDGFYTAQHNTN